MDSFLRVIQSPCSKHNMEGKIQIPCSKHAMEGKIYLRFANNREKYFVLNQKTLRLLGPTYKTCKFGKGDMNQQKVLTY